MGDGSNNDCYQPLGFHDHYGDGDGHRATARQWFITGGSRVVKFTVGDPPKGPVPGWQRRL